MRMKNKRKEISVRTPTVERHHISGRAFADECMSATGNAQKQ
jgi:hypothetical protein